MLAYFKSLTSAADGDRPELKDAKTCDPMMASVRQKQGTDNDLAFAHHHLDPRGIAEAGQVKCN